MRGEAKRRRRGSKWAVSAPAGDRMVGERALERRTRQVAAGLTHDPCRSALRLLACRSDGRSRASVSCLVRRGTLARGSCSSEARAALAFGRLSVARTLGRSQEQVVLELRKARLDLVRGHRC